MAKSLWRAIGARAGRSSSPTTGSCAAGPSALAKAPACSPRPCRRSAAARKRRAHEQVGFRTAESGGRRCQPGRGHRRRDGFLRVGGVGAISTLQTSLTVALTTALVGAHGGPGAVAGYGTGARLEYLLIPLVSAGLARVVRPRPAHARDRRRLPALRRADLRLLGLGLSLYFASQGAGRLAWPLFGGLLRMLIAVGGGWLVLSFTASLNAAFAALGLALVVYGVTVATAIASGVWFRAPRSAAACASASHR